MSNPSISVLKQSLIDTTLGHWAFAARDKLELLRAAWSNPHIVGTLANDQMAAWLVGCLCERGKVFVDVGAHIGSVIADVRRRSKPSHIVAVEAIPAKAEAMRRKFPGVEIAACAVGDTEGGQVPFFVDVQRPGYSSLGRSTEADAQLIEIQVPMRTLDSVLAGADVDTIKIDIEGAELGALRGANKVMRRCRPIVMFESAPDAGERLGYSPAALWQHFDGIGYAIVAPNRLAHNDGGMTLDAFVDSHAYPRRTTNYFGIARERRIEVRDRARALLAG
jgi:FkbM family methyltransferase